MCCLLVLTTHSSPFLHFPWTPQIHFRETCLFDRTRCFWNPLLAKGFLLSVLMPLLQLSSLREPSPCASGVSCPEVLNFVHNELVTDTSLWTDLVLGIPYLSSNSCLHILKSFWSSEEMSDVSYSFQFWIYTHYRKWPSSAITKQKFTSSVGCEVHLVPLLPEGIIYMIVPVGLISQSFCLRNF